MASRSQFAEWSPERVEAMSERNRAARRREIDPVYSAAHRPAMRPAQATLDVSTVVGDELADDSLDSIKIASKKPTKHRNVKVVVDGEVIDSKKEARRRAELRLAGRGGYITELAFQVEFFLGVHKDEAGHAHVCKYIADSVYVDAKGVKHVEDVKSVHTRTLQTYVLKKKLMKALLNIEIEEV